MSPTTRKQDGFSAEEKAATRARAKELKLAAEGEEAIRGALAGMDEKDRRIGERIHELVQEIAPDLTPKTWYGMPAYARDGKVLIYYRDARKFKERYAMLGFQDNASLDDGSVWPVAYAVDELDAAAEKKIRALVKKAVG